MYKYICEDCHNTTTEDVWYCINCSDESRIHQILIKNYEYETHVSFHQDVSYELARDLLSHVSPKKEGYSKSEGKGLTFVFR